MNKFLRDFFNTFLNVESIIKDTPDELCKYTYKKESFISMLTNDDKYNISHHNNHKTHFQIVHKITW